LRKKVAHLEKEDVWQNFIVGVTRALGNLTLREVAWEKLSKKLSTNKEKDHEKTHPRGDSFSRLKLQESPVTASLGGTGDLMEREVQRERNRKCQRKSS